MSYIALVYSGSSLAMTEVMDKETEKEFRPFIVDAVKESDVTLVTIHLANDKEIAEPWQLALEISASVPDDEWAKIPTDLAKNLDYYLYGSP